MTRSLLYQVPYSELICISACFDTLRFLKHGADHAFKCLLWPCPAAIIRDTNCDTLSPCATCFGEQVSSNCGTLYGKRDTLQFTCALALGLVLHNYTTKGYPLLLSCFIGSCHVWGFGTPHVVSAL